MGRDDRTSHPRRRTSPGGARTPHVTPRIQKPHRGSTLHLPHRTHWRARQFHRRRGDATLRASTTAVVVGGLVVASVLSLFAFKATTDQVAARAAVQARLLAAQRQAHDVQQAELARQRAAQAAAQARAERVARLAAVRAAQERSAAATAAAQTAVAAASAQAAAATAASAASGSSGGAGTGSTASQTPAASVSQSAPVASSGGS